MYFDMIYTREAPGRPMSCQVKLQEDQCPAEWSSNLPLHICLEVFCVFN